MRYKNLEIKNFRGIEYLKIDDLKQFNLFTGRNNSGKTSILEAFFLMSGMSNPQLPISIHSFRELILTEDDDFSFMFHNLDFSLSIEFLSQLDQCHRKLKIDPIYKNELYSSVLPKPSKDISSTQKILSSSASPIHDVQGLNLKFDDENKKNKSKFESRISLNHGKMNLATEYKESLQCSFINLNTMITQIDKKLERLIVQKQLENIISVLQEIKPEIVDLRLGTSGMVYVDLGKDKLFPVNIMGDGIRRILAILVTIAEMRGGVLLVDEIENGLHYSSLKVMWNAVFKACQMYDVQLFATTHSYECIESFANLYQEHESDEIRLYRLECNGTEHKVIQYSKDVLRTGIQNEIEVR